MFTGIVDHVGTVARVAPGQGGGRTLVVRHRFTSALELVGKCIGGVKIALIPVAQDTSPQVASTGDLMFLPTVETGIAAAKQAREDGADLVVGVVQTADQ